MQTWRLNRAMTAASAAVTFILLCLVSYLLSSPRNQYYVRTISPDAKISNEEVTAAYTSRQPKTRPHRSEIKSLMLQSSSKASSSMPITQHSVDENEMRKKKVVEMMTHAWNGYKNYSWGENELRPVSKTFHTQGVFGGRNMPATIVDAADTLWIMGLNNAYMQARDYIRDNFDIKKATGSLSVFETNIRFLGGLLSLYALTGEEFYIDKARNVGEALLPAFKTPTGLAKSNLDVQSKTAFNYGWANGGSSVLAEFGSLHLEFVYLSHISKAPIFEKKVKKIRDFMDRVGKVDGLYSNYIDSDTGKWTQPYHISLGAMGDSFYEYLIKSWLQTGKTDEQARRMYWDVSKVIQEKMIFTSKSGLKYTAELRNGFPQHKMGHLACFVVGMFALQAANEKEPQRVSTMKLAEELGNTCHESYSRSTTRIGPEMFYFSDSEDATSRRSENNYILRPEVIEGFFYLWRLTGKTIYRDWVWNAIQAIDMHCRVEAGFSGINNVYEPSKGHDDVQQSFFLAETLKYAYLTFADNSVLPLDKWVFNTEAHPLPVLARNQ